MDDFKRLDELLNKMFERTISDEERSEIQTMIKNSEEARERYLQFCQVHAILSEQNGSLASMPDFPSEKKTKPAPIAFIIAVAAAAMLFIAFNSGLFAKKPVETVEGPHRGSNIALIAKASGVEFLYGGKDNSRLVEGDQIPTGVYSMIKGVLQLDFPNGVSTVIEAPCEFELISTMNVGCREGKISANVPTEAKGFTISANGVSIVDLGTEFAVHAVKGKFVEAHVFNGKVAVNMHYETGDQKYEVGEGQAVRVLMGETGPVMAGIDLKNDFFIRQMTEPDSDYSKFILTKEPVAYFSMDIESDGKTLRDRSIYKNNGTASAVKEVANLWSAGKIGSSVKLAGSNHKAYVTVDDYPKTDNNTLSVVGWVYAESRPVWATIMKNWGNKKFGQFHFGLDIKGYLDVEIQGRDGEKPHITDSEKFPIKEWQHVAFVHDGQTVKVFRNGVVVAEGAVNGIKYPVDLKKMSIGTKLDDSEMFPAPGTQGHWDGRLDELAVFNKALTDQEILELYEIGK